MCLLAILDLILLPKDAYELFLMLITKISNIWFFASIVAHNAAVQHYLTLFWDKK